jgi:uncharacterized membrane protein
VLGIFAGIFTYCLIVLRTIRGGDEGGFVPSLAVSFSVVLAIGGIGVLIFFIHHIASSIQASNIIASVAEETMVAVDRLFPEKLGNGPVDSDEDQSPLPCRSGMAGRLRPGGMVISKAWITQRSCVWRVKHQTIVRMEHGIGEFVVHDTTLASLALENPPEKRSSPPCRRHTASVVTARWNRIPPSASDRSWIWPCVRSPPASTTPRRP